jgi:hypothetical protein
MLSADERPDHKEFSMKAYSRFLGHSTHRILVTFPVALLGTSFFFDIKYKGEAAASRQANLN